MHGRGTSSISPRLPLHTSLNGTTKLTSATRKRRLSDSSNAKLSLTSLRSIIANRKTRRASIFAVVLIILIYGSVQFRRRSTPPVFQRDTFQVVSTPKLLDRAPSTPQPGTRDRSAKGHIYDDNGLLYVDPKGRHPIMEMIERAEKDWNELVNRQSKTLKEAVQEYRRRYRKNPPKGFDLW